MTRLAMAMHINDFRLAKILYFLIHNNKIRICIKVLVKTSSSTVAEFRLFQLLLKRQRWRHFGKKVAYCTYHTFKMSPVTSTFFPFFLLCVYHEIQPWEV